MSLNSSHSINVSTPFPFLSSPNSSLDPPLFKCFNSTAASYIFTTFACSYFLIFFPPSILVLYLGHQRWRQQRSVSTAMMISHSDLFTYNIIAMEMIGFFGSGFYCSGIYIGLPRMMMVGIYIFSFILPGQLVFHSLTCIDRYLAVVHPITYLSLRNASWVRLRNISIGCVWLLGSGWMALTALTYPNFPTTPFFCFFVFFLILISFCSLSVLHALVRPKPGDVGRDKERVDQLKQRAFQTITVIMGVLLLKFGGLVICNAVDASPLVSYEDGCVALMSGLWFGMPSSLVLQFQFLHRAGKLPCCRYNKE